MYYHIVVYVDNKQAYSISASDKEELREAVDDFLEVEEMTGYHIEKIEGESK